MVFDSAFIPFIVISMTKHVERLRREVEVLLVTATASEKDALLARMSPLRGEAGVLKGALGPATYYIGQLGTHAVALTRCRAGSVGAGASKDAVADGCKIWQPRAVIMVGIAFGADPDKQKVGDVLVSTQIISYAERRQGEKSVFRGPRPESSRVLIDRFQNVDRWTFARPDGSLCAVRPGPVLSGETLVDDLAFKAELVAAFPDAVGGEMEGRGLYAAAQEVGVPWILVKAISDWADGKKSKQDQPFAAAAAVDLVRAVLSDPGALEGLPDGERQDESRSTRGQGQGRTPAIRGSRGAIVAGRDINAGILITGNSDSVGRRTRR